MRLSTKAGARLSAAPCPTNWAIQHTAWIVAASMSALGRSAKALAVSTDTAAVDDDVQSTSRSVEAIEGEASMGESPLVEPLARKVRIPFSFSTHICVLTDVYGS